MRLGFFRDGRFDMPEDEGQAGATPAEPKVTVNNPPAQSPEQSLGEAGQRAIREERARAKAAEKERDEAVARLKKLDEEKLSEHEKATRRAEEAERRAAEAESRALRLEVVTETGLPAAMAGRLQGATKDELLADAESLRSLLAPVNGTNGDGQGGTEAPPNAANRRIPRPDPSQGGGRPTESRSVAAGAALYAERKQQQVTPFTT